MANPCEVNGDQAVSDRLSNVYASRMRSLSDDLLHSTLSLEDWHTQMQDAIRLAFLHQAIAGAPDSDERLISSADMRRIERNIAEQYKFLDKFASDIESAVVREGASLDFIPSRASLYAQSSGAEYWKQALNVDLPAVPRDGSTQCLGNCQCQWDLQCADDGIVLATWLLESGESCPDCKVRAETWNPLRVSSKAA